MSSYLGQVFGCFVSAFSRSRFPALISCSIIPRYHTSTGYFLSEINMDPQEERIAEEVNDVDVTTEEVNAVGGTAANSEQQTSRKVGLSMSCLGPASGLTLVLLIFIVSFSSRFM